MDAAFLLIVAKRPGVDPSTRVPAPVTEGDLAFGDATRRERSRHGGAVHVVAWQGPTSLDEHSWADGSSSTTVVAGRLRRRRSTWSPTDTAHRLARDASDRDVGELQGELRGVFAAAHVTAGGDGWIISDPLGLRCLYRGEDADVHVVGTRAALVARALAPGATPPRDPGPFAWMAFVGHHVGDQSGFRGVQVVPPGEWLRLRGGSVGWESAHPFVVDRAAGDRPGSLGEVAEVVQDDVADGLRAALELPGGRKVIRLTGGKDSRLLLAIAVRAGLADAFAYQTMGPPDLADVVIAGRLCEELGLPHETRFLEGRHAEAYGERFRRFVHHTGGLVSGWDMNTPVQSDEVHLTGLGGEPLRRYVPVDAPRLARDGLAAAVPRRTYGQLGLLDPAQADELHRRLLDRLATEPHPDAHPLDKVHALYAGSRMRFTRFGPREEQVGVHREHPLYSSGALGAAMAMDPVDRTEEVLFAELMRLGDPSLVQIPFANGGWTGRALGHLEAVGCAPPAGPTAPSPGVRTGPVMATIQGGGGPERTELLEACVAEASSPAWEVLDRSAAAHALGRFTDLTRRQQAELFGAATAVVWLGG